MGDTSASIIRYGRCVYANKSSFETLHLLGLWRTQVVENESIFMNIRSDIAMEMAATLTVNPTTAYRMLKDYVHLEKGLRMCVRC